MADFLLQESPKSKWQEKLSNFYTVSMSPTMNITAILNDFYIMGVQGNLHENRIWKEAAGINFNNIPSLDGF